MYVKVLVAVVIATAVAVASLLLTLHSNLVKDVFLVTRFFEAMLPILAAGALLKYLLTFRSRS